METDIEHQVIEEKQVLNVEANNVEMMQSCSINVLADDVKMDKSSAVIVKADNVRMKDSFALILKVDNAEGDVKALFSPASALIAGGIALLGIYLWRRR
jgi:hypothetical protein